MDKNSVLNTVNDETLFARDLKSMTDEELSRMIQALKIRRAVLNGKNIVEFDK